MAQRARDWLDDCADRLSATRRLMDFALALGFDFVAYLEPQRIDVEDASTEAALRAIWMLQPHRIQTWHVPNPIETWPIAAQCVDSDTPFVWHPDDPKYFAPTQFPSRQRTTVQGFYRRFRFSAAMTTPVHLEGHRFGFMSWFTCDPTASPETEWFEMVPRLQRVAKAYLTAIAAMPSLEGVQKASGLSAREVECLRWSALGKSAEEIGGLLGRSSETARFHLKNAVRKLGANNRVHAIALASYRQLLGDLSGLRS